MSIKTVLWNIVPLSAPTVVKNCSKCGGQAEFACSGNFRINAQQRNLDVWLIYQCKHCQTTWNMELYSRVKPNQLPPDLYDHFLHNDSATAMKYAFDRQVLDRNKATANYEAVEYVIQGKTEWDRTDDEIMLVINSAYAIPLRADKILCEQLHLSRKDITKLFQSGTIVNLSNDKNEKAKINGSLKLKLDCKEIQLYREEKEQSLQNQQSNPAV
jgi:hypothetical protein